jgi:hypothetical protein
MRSVAPLTKARQKLALRKIDGFDCLNMVNEGTNNERLAIHALPDVTR